MLLLSYNYSSLFKYGTYIIANVSTYVYIYACIWLAVKYIYRKNLILLIIILIKNVKSDKRLLEQSNIIYDKLISRTIINKIIALFKCFFNK